MLYPHLAGRLFGVPLLIHRPKLDVILSVMAPRLGLDGPLPQAALLSSRPVASPTPGIAILLTALSFNALGESVRIALDPTMKRR